MDYQLQILSRAQIDPVRWDAFIETSAEGGLFSLFGYLTALDENWQAAVVVDRQGQWQAVMPYTEVRKWGFKMVVQPAFSQSWGPCFKPLQSLSLYKQYSRKREWGQLLVKAWKKAHLVVQNSNPAFDYPMPFFEAGFALHTRYTFVLDLKQEQQTLWMGLESNLRRRIRRVESMGMQIVELNKTDGLLALYAAQKANGNDILGVAKNAGLRLEKLTQYLHQSQRGNLVGLQTEQGKLLAAGAFARFGEKYLYLWGTYLPGEAPSGAMAWLLWQQVVKAQQDGCLIFDFEGSMMPDIARFFRRFGARPIPYLQLHKNALPLLLRWILEFR